MKMRKELNNKGFSLVELLIATIILGIVVAPLLHTFVTAANTTARSRQIGDATLAGKNIAEMVEAGSIADLANGRIFTGATVTSTDGCYDVTIPSITAGSSTFAAKVTVDPGAYHKDPDDDEATDLLNDVLMADYSQMDGIYAQDLDVRNPDDLAYKAFTIAANTKHLGATAGEGSGGQEGEQATTKEVWLPSSVEPVRTMTLDITEQTTGSQRYYKAILSLEYAYDYLYEVIDVGTGERLSQERGHIELDTPYTYDLMSAGFSEADEGRLPNLYVMFYPLYYSSKINDIIYINNNVAKPFKIFLVKEKADDPLLDVKENAYNATVVQNVPAGTQRGNYAVVYSNIREDLVDGHNLRDQVTYEIRRGLIFSDRGYFGGSNPDNEPLYKGGDLVSKSAGDRMYDVTVEIFDVKDTGFTTPIHTSYSSKLK